MAAGLGAVGWWRGGTEGSPPPTTHVDAVAKPNLSSQARHRPAPSPHFPAVAPVVTGEMTLLQW